jgi:hypothetical protein
MILKNKRSSSSSVPVATGELSRELFVVRHMDINTAELFYLGVAGTGLLALVLQLAFW